MQVQLKFIIFSFHIVSISKKQNLSTKCRPRGEKLFSERISFGIKRKCLGRGSTENLDMEVAGSSMRRYMQSLPLFLCPHLLKSLRFSAVPEWVGLWYLCGWFRVLWQLHHSSDSSKSIFHLLSYWDVNVMLVCFRSTLQPCVESSGFAESF